MMKLTPGQAMDEVSSAALASGRAEPALVLFIESLMELRGHAFDAGEVLAGAALEAEAPAELSAGALERALAAVDAAAPVSRRQLEYPDLIQIPAPLLDRIRAAEARSGWRMSAPGIRKLTLPVGGEALAEVIRIDAGVAVPWHTHKGQELTLCLLGGFSDGKGSYGPGDFTYADTSVRHRPVADADAPCFVLAVTDAGLKFEGVLGAIQKLIGG